MNQSESLRTIAGLADPVTPEPNKQLNRIFLEARSALTTELQQAVAIANKWLEKPPDMMGDPDCDRCILARQFLRLMERTPFGNSPETK